MKYQDDQFPETTREFETTTYGVLIQKPQVERLCKNCRFWKQYCNNGHFIHSEISPVVEPEDNGWPVPPVLSGSDAYLVAEYSVSFYPGPNFGCIHFEEK